MNVKITNLLGLKTIVGSEYESVRAACEKNKSNLGNADWRNLDLKGQTFKALTSKWQRSGRQSWTRRELKAPGWPAQKPGQ